MSKGIEDPKAAIIIRPNIMLGNAKIASTPRLRTMSVDRPATAAAMPKVIPTK